MSNTNSGSSGRDEERGKKFAAYVREQVVEQGVDDVNWSVAMMTAEAAGRRGNGNKTIQVFLGNYNKEEWRQEPRRVEISVIERFLHAGIHEADVVPSRDELVSAVAVLAMSAAVGKHRLQNWERDQVEDKVDEVLERYVIGS